MKALRYLVVAVGATTAMPSAAQELFGANQFDGFYAGVIAETNYVTSYALFAAGVLAGVRFGITDSLVVGAEATVSKNLMSQASFDTATAVGTVGFVVEEDILLYAGAGVAVVQSGPVQTVGRGVAGVEFAATDLIHFRGQVAGTFVPLSPAFYTVTAAVLFQF